MLPLIVRRVLPGGRITRAPITHLTPLRPPHRSLNYNHLDDKAKQAVKDAAGSGIHITF